MPPEHSFLDRSSFTDGPSGSGQRGRNTYDARTVSPDDYRACVVRFIGSVCTCQFHASGLCLALLARIISQLFPSPLATGYGWLRHG